MIAILGGSFDPIHYGHLRSAECLQRLLGCETFLLMPMAEHPFGKQTLFNADQRLSMVRLALAEFPTLSLSTLEVEAGGVSYTLNTLQSLTTLHPQETLCWVVGEDCLPRLPSWNSAYKLANYAHLIVLSRQLDNEPQTSVDSYDIPKILERCNFSLTRSTDALWRQSSRLCYFAPIPTIPLSSTLVRTRIIKRGSLEGLTPRAVADLISEPNSQML